jgi:beta-xylosidase
MEFPNCMSTRGIFAPTIRYHEGTFFMVTTNVNHEGHRAPGSYMIGLAAGAFALGRLSKVNKGKK